MGAGNENSYSELINNIGTGASSSGRFAIVNNNNIEGTQLNKTDDV